MYSIAWKFSLHIVWILKMAFFLRSVETFLDSNA